MQRKNDELMSIESEIREIIEGLGYDFVEWNWSTNTEE